MCVVLEIRKTIPTNAKDMRDSPRAHLGFAANNFNGKTDVFLTMGWKGGLVLQNANLERSIRTGTSAL